MSSKSQFAVQIMSSATKLAQAIDECAAISEVYADMCYDSGGGAITDQDMVSASMPITAAQIAAFVALVPTIQSFWATSHTAINRLRADL